MQNKEDSIAKKLYASMIDTLKLISFSNNGIEEFCQSNLEEFEGDYYTFLNPVNIEKIYIENLITNKTKKTLLQLFEIIHNLDSKKWNTNAFFSDKDWKQVRDLSGEIMESFDGNIQNH